MNTNIPDQNNSNNTVPVQPLPPQYPSMSNNASNPIVELTNQLSSVDVNTSDAVLNATSISDNNGGRIELVDTTPASNGLSKIE